MIESGFMYLASLVLFAGVVATLEMKYKDVTFFKYVPTPVILYVGCMLFATFDLWAGNDAIRDTYRTVRGHLIPAMIFVMLLRCDFRKIAKLSGRMIAIFLGCSITLALGFIVGFPMSLISVYALYKVLKMMNTESTEYEMTPVLWGLFSIRRVKRVVKDDGGEYLGLMNFLVILGFVITNLVIWVNVT